MPAQDLGRHRAAKKSTAIGYQGESTPLSTMSSGAMGSRTSAAPSRARAHGARTYPSLAWYRNSDDAAPSSAPLTA